MVVGERFNSISHLIGTALALVGATVLVTMAAVAADTVKIVSFTVYGVSLVLLYLASTLYHSLVGRAKAVFRKLDHGAIFLLIAGTYTPFALIALDGRGGWILLCLIWATAAIGILIDNLPIPGPRIVPVVLYLLMSWAGMVMFDAFVLSLSSAALTWLLIGGVVYTVGVVFFLLDHWYPWCHGVWHLFVLGGSVSHFISIALL